VKSEISLDTGLQKLT